jgi:methylmalonyl-CoA/ethylmalonyl-CoA epimerase
MVRKIDHIGIAVSSLEEGLGFYEALGLACVGRETVASQQVEVAFIEVGESRIELLEPTGPRSPIARFLEKRGQGIHHVCLQVNDLESRLAELKAAGIRLINNGPVVGAGGCRVAFVHPGSAGGVLIELSQPGPAGITE